MSLEKLREEVDEIDKKVLELLSKRKKVVEQIGKIKQEKHLVINDKNREDELIKNVIKKGQTLGLEGKYLRKLYKEIIKYSKKVQKK
ncbi:hypothetical protein COU61_02235 [Candidatus Pacearchaeota archaeon CG10_big_fil_rev_8_21_14_0_10_35_13]|nr:MAG: hypothetical protein COU61_02235 [Candidatus Pacearchaeota archaeon CG10_big_fil_rev_8_21_14_0_10_35_13]